MSSSEEEKAGDTKLQTVSSSGSSDEDSFQSHQQVVKPFRKEDFMGSEKEEKKLKKQQKKLLKYGKSAFQDYLSYMNQNPPETNPLSQDSPSGIPQFEYQDQVAVEELIKLFGTQREWKSEEVEHDIKILHENRCKTVKDLRILSKSSWKEISLLPITKDLLREAILRKTPQNSTQSSSCSNPFPSKSIETIRSGGALRPGRCHVYSDDGKVYEIDRLCPHKGADLSKAIICNGVLSCPKHHWKFDLANGGRCNAKGATVNAVCVVNNW